MRAVRPECKQCDQPTDLDFWVLSGGLCGHCLAFGAMPLIRVPRGGVKIYGPGEVVPSIKYGEWKWGAFA